MQKLHKTEAIDTLRNNGIDITLASKKLMILTLSEQYNMSLQKFNNSEVSFEEFFHYMEGRMAYQIDGLENYVLVELEGSVKSIHGCVLTIIL